MAQLEEGSPLGLQLFNVRVALGRGSDYSGSISFNTLVFGSPTLSTDSSKESTGSFFPDKSITLGSLMGASSIYGFSKGSTRVRRPEAMKEKKSNRSGVRFFSLCSRDTTDARSVCIKDGPSLGHLLAVERGAAANELRINGHDFKIYRPEGLMAAQGYAEANTLFVDGRIAPS